MTILRKFKKEWANSPVQKTIALSMLAITFITCFQKYILFGMNTTESLPQKIFIMVKIKPEMIRDKYYGFKYVGKSNSYYSPGAKFVKKLVGVPGDNLKADFNDKSITLITEKETGTTFKLLEKDSKGRILTEQFGFNGKIPEKKYFFVGESKNSYDSRYWGLVDEKDIIGRAYPLL